MVQSCPGLRFYRFHISVLGRPSARGALSDGGSLAWRVFGRQVTLSHVVRV